MVSVDMRPPTTIPKKQGGPVFEGPPVLGMTAPSCGELCAKPPHPCSLLLCVGTPSQSDNCGVHNQLATSKQREPIHDNFQPACICRPWIVQVQIANHDVGGNPPTGLPANSGCRTFQCEPSSPQHDCSCTRCSVVAKLVNLTATPASVQRKRQWKLETSQ